MKLLTFKHGGKTQIGFLENLHFAAASAPGIGGTGNIVRGDIHDHPCLSRIDMSIIQGNLSNCKQQFCKHRIFPGKVARARLHGPVKKAKSNISDTDLTETDICVHMNRAAGCGIWLTGNTDGGKGGVGVVFHAETAGHKKYQRAEGAVTGDVASFRNGFTAA